MLDDNLSEVLEEIKGGNNLGEPITLVGATKTVDADTINRAISLGLKIVGDNKVQEFRDKSPYIRGAEFHFIGRLQKNKVKYLIGKVSLIHSVDSVELAEEIDRLSAKKGVSTDILIEVNVSGEESKSGFAPDDVFVSAAEIAKLESVRLKGIMTMLPHTDDENLLAALCRKTRAIFDTLKNTDERIEFLSMGMSNDYRIAIKNGSNMIRLGTRLFGARNYNLESEK